MKIHFRYASDNDPFVPAIALLAGWIIKTVLHLVSPGNTFFVPVGTFTVIAFNILALVIVISFLRNNKGAEFFRAIIALVVVGVATGLIDWALFG